MPAWPHKTSDIGTGQQCLLQGVFCRRPVAAHHMTPNEVGSCRSNRFRDSSRIPSALLMSSCLLLFRQYVVPNGSPVFSTFPQASETICAEIDGSATLRTDAVHNGRFHVGTQPNWDFKPHNSPLINQLDFFAQQISRLTRSNRFSLHAICGRSSGCETRLFTTVDFACQCL